MKIKLVADSSANLHTLEGIAFSSVPLKILAGAAEYVDDENLDVSAMMEGLHACKGKPGTSCPSVGDWLDAFGDADMVLGVSITSQLSGSYNSASLAAEEYMNTHPDRKVFILDSLSTGPEMELILEKYVELVEAGKSFEDICTGIRAYHARTRLLFSLESLSNLAKNGRVSPAVAAVAGLLGIRVIGRASDHGTLEPMHKSRGERKALSQLVKSMAELGCKGGKVRISHTHKRSAAEALANLIRTAFPESRIAIRPNTGLCSFYAEEGGILIGFEV